MKVIRNKLIPVKGFKAINMFGVLFVRKGVSMRRMDYTHEAIHTCQMKELLYVGFYLLYVVEWVVRLVQCKFHDHEAYRAISFEREAYSNQCDTKYPNKTRKRYSWLKYL